MNAEEFEVKWLEIFSQNISIGGFLWGIFSSEIVKCLSRDDAKIEYNIVDKTGAIEILFDPCVDHYRSISNPFFKNHFTAEQIQKSDLCEFYVIGKDFSWCYVVTHEEQMGLGPYFCYAEK